MFLCGGWFSIVFFDFNGVKKSSKSFLTAQLWARDIASNCHYHNYENYTILIIVKAKKQMKAEIQRTKKNRKRQQANQRQTTKNSNNQ